MKRFAPIILPVVLPIAALLASCAETPMGPSATAPSAGPPVYESGSANVFRAQDFAWSVPPGAGSIVGSLAYRPGGVRYSCQGGDVILTPETPWTRRRMIILYGSALNAAVPLEIVRARTPSAPSGDYASYAKKTTCDAANRFSFAGLADGAWFVITLAKPLDGPGEAIAVMRRVETAGAARSVVLN